MKNNRLNVALAFDDNYAKYAYVTILSLLINNSDFTIDFYILQSNLSESSKKVLNGLCNKYSCQMHFLSVKKSLFSNKLPVTAKWPIEVYYRLLLPNLLPEHVDRILYIDSDIIVNTSVSEFYFIDLGENALAGCYDLTLLGVDAETFLYYRDKKLLPYFEDRTYINSGSVLFNITKLRESFHIDKYLNAAEELNYNIYAPDQDLINYVHDGYIKLLDSRKFNYPAYIAFLENIDTNSIKSIIHFTGPKPWQGGNHAHFPIESLWWKYACLTPFKEAFMEEYINDSVNNLTIIQELEGTDKVKVDLVKENAQLKKELNRTLESMSNIIKTLEKGRNTQ